MAHLGMAKSFNHAVDYNPETDILALERIWSAENHARKVKERYLGRHAENIQANRARGMSRYRLEQIYGVEAVTLAIGHSSDWSK